MSKLDQTVTVGEWVAQHPQSVRVFEEHQIDYCCGGNRSLAQACAAKGLNADRFASQLLTSIAQTQDAPEVNWSDRPLHELCNHIEATHHAYLKTELPRLAAIVEKVAKVHGPAHPELLDIRLVYMELWAELEPHMVKEERILFPAIRHLEKSSSQPRFPFGTVANPIRMMEHEHDIAGNALQRIRSLTNDYHVPDDACNTWRVMLDGLAHLERDLHQHIHKENNILFPRAKTRELAGSST